MALFRFASRGSKKKGSVDKLIAALRDEDREKRSTAAKTLGELGDARAMESLIGALSDEWLIVRAAAAQALGRLGDARAVQPLIAALADEDE